MRTPLQQLAGYVARFPDQDLAFQVLDHLEAGDVHVHDDGDRRVWTWPGGGFGLHRRYGRGVLEHGDTTRDVRLTGPSTATW